MSIVDIRCKRGKFLSMLVFTAVLTLLFSVSNTDCKTFYIDPQNGSIDNDGSKMAPWSTLKEVFNSGKIQTRDWASKPPQSTTQLVLKNVDGPVGPGDTLLLLTGYHGNVYASGYYNQDFVTIMAAPGHKPRLAALELRSGCRWLIKGLTISPSFSDSLFKTTLINFSSHGYNGNSYLCYAEENSGYSVEDVSAWSLEDWNALPSSAMSLPEKSVARRNYFKNVNFGISCGGDSSLIEYNTIENFAGDGLRGIGNYQVFQYNTIMNCYDVNENHDDGFQSWSTGDSGVGTGVVKGMILRGNTIINYTDINQPFRGTLQGIGCFDGMFEDWVVENNIIAVDHWHGISLYGAKNCRVVNNTVVDLNSASPGPPWIKITEHKNGTSPVGCLVRNNLTTAISCSNTGVTIDNNIIVKDYDTYFVDYSGGNFHLKDNCDAINAGVSEFAPEMDRDGIKRPVGSGIDIGAYEFRPGSSSITLYWPVSNQILSTVKVFDLRGRCVSDVRNDRELITKGQLGTNLFLLHGQANHNSAVRHIFMRRR